MRLHLELGRDHQSVDQWYTIIERWYIHTSDTSATTPHWYAMSEPGYSNPISHLPRAIKAVGRPGNGPPAITVADVQEPFDRRRN